MGVNPQIKEITKDNNQCIVMFVPKEVHTGGERYLVEVFAYLQQNRVQIKPIYIKNFTKERHGISLMMNCIVDNFYYFWQVKKFNNLSNLIFFEDFHLHPRLWLFNMLMRITTGKLRTVVLMQSSLSYHNSLKRRYMRNIDGLIVRIFLRQASLILTNSNFTRQQALSVGKNPEQVKAIYCGYESTMAREAFKTRVAEKHKISKHILFVGQCAKVKGIEYLLQAITMISNNQVILDIVGNTAVEPKYFSQLNKTIGELGIHDQVIFHGHISDKTELAKFYQHSDVFVLPSLVEGFGIVLLDAMSFGLPIVATRVSAIPELVEDDVNGLLVPPANPAALAQAIEHLLDSPTQRKEYGQAGYDFVSEHREFYSWEAVGERALKEMQPLLKETKC